MKKIWLLCILLVMSMVILMSCGKSDNSNNENTDTPKAANFNVDSVSYTPEVALIDGDRLLSLTFTNNSSFDIHGIEATLYLKDDVEDLSSFNSIMDEADITEDELKEVYFMATLDKVLPPGETSKPIPISVGGMYDILNKTEQYDCMRMDNIIYHYRDGDKIYSITYDALNDRMGEPQYEEKAPKWPTSEFGSLIPVYDGGVISGLTEYGEKEKQNRFCSVEIQSVTVDQYDSYVKQAIKAGFNDGDTNSDNGFVSMKDSNGNTLEIWYFDSDSKMSIHLEEKNWE